MLRGNPIGSHPFNHGSLGWHRCFGYECFRVFRVFRSPLQFLRVLSLLAANAEDGRKDAHEAHGSWAPFFFLPSQGTSYTSTSAAPPAPLPVTSVVYSPAGRVMSNMASFDDGLVTAKAPTAALAAVS